MIEQEPRDYDCLIWGGYGWGNTGDEICLAVALERMKKNGVAAGILSHRPEYTSRLFPASSVVPYAPRSRSLLRPWRHFAGSPSGHDWHDCLARSRRLFLAGGGYLTDLFPLDFYLQPIQMASQAGLPIETAPLGMGPFRSRRWATRVADSLKRSELKVRDEFSLAFCQSHHLSARLEVDDAFALRQVVPLVPEGRSTAPAVAGPDSSVKKIGVCIFNQYGEGKNYDLRAWWVRCLRELSVQLPAAQIEGFCFHTSLQYEFNEMAPVFADAGLPVERIRAPRENFREAVAALQTYDFIIATRFHAIVAANVLQTPNIAIASGDYYLAKMKAAVRGYESFSHLINPVVHEPGRLSQICSEALNQ